MDGALLAALAPAAEYVAHRFEQTSHHLCRLAYDMDGAPLTYGRGAPLRLRNELQHGFRHVKWLKGIEFVAHYYELGSGQDGYNENHEFSGVTRSSNAPELKVAAMRREGFPAPRRCVNVSTNWTVKTLGRYAPHDQ